MKTNVTSLRARDIEVEYRPVSGLVPYAKNARVHSEAQVVEIANSIRRFGFVNPVLVDGDGMIIAGHGRVLAARRAGVESVPVIVLGGLSKSEVRALALADNKIAMNSGWDAELLKEELQNLADDGTPINDLGFAQEELADLMADEPGLSVFEVDTGDVSDRFWISIRGPLVDQAEALARITGVLETLSNVEVELGTIAGA